MFSGLRSLFHRDEIQPVVCRQVIDTVPTPYRPAVDGRKRGTGTVPLSKPVTPKRSRSRTGTEPLAKPRADLRQLEHHSAPEHAKRLLEWVERNVETTSGHILYDAMREYYAEMLIEAGWHARGWQWVAREFDLLTTGGEKPYVWVRDEYGRQHKLRCYPLPRMSGDGVSAEPLPERRVA
jgi:hypothetical protein